MVGNVWEWTAGQISTATGQDNGTDGLWMGQSFFTTNYVTFASLGSGNYDLLRGLPKGTAAAPVVFDSADIYFYSSGLRGPLRGGSRYEGSNAGRWCLALDSDLTRVDNGVSLRCSL